MKARKNSQSDRSEKRVPRKVLWGAAAGASFGLLLASISIFSAPGKSPRQRVEARVTRGEKIEPATPSGSNTISISFAPLRQSNADAVPSSLDLRQPPLAAANGRPIPPPSFDRPTNFVVLDGKRYLSTSFAELSAFHFKPSKDTGDAGPAPAFAVISVGEQVPGNIKWLNEKQVALTSFMLPVRVVSGLTTDFLLLKNQMACCFGIKPNANEWVVVHAAGKGVKPTMDVPVTVVGTFHVGELREEGHFIGIYMLECDGLLHAKGNP